MKKIILVIVCIFYATILNALNIKLSDYSINLANLIDMKENSGKIYVLGIKGVQPGIYDHSAIKYFDGIKWDSLPQSFVSSGSEIPLTSALESQINFDSLGNLWLSGYSLYCFKYNKWNEYYIDDSVRQYRQYQHFCIDKFNNIWVNTLVYKEPDIKYSEILKFDGFKFISIKKSNYLSAFSHWSENCVGNTISALPDGRVCFLRAYVKGFDSDFDSEYKGLYFFNQDGTNQTINLQVNTGDTSFLSDKYLSSIYTESSGKTWYCLDYNVWSSTGQINNLDYACCSGLSLLNNDNWTLFGEKNNLPYFRNPDSSKVKVFNAIYNIAKIGYNEYLINAHNHIYSMGNDYKLKSIDLLKIGMNTTIIRANNWDQEYDYSKYYKMILDSAGAKSLNTPGSIIPFQGKIWIMTRRGIVTFSKDVITSIQDDNFAIDNNFILYPNPVDEILNISNFVSYERYEIIDILGIKISGGLFGNGQIPVTILPSGIYYFKLYFGKNYQIKCFVKQ